MTITRKILYVVVPLLLAAVPQGARAGVTIKQEMTDLKTGQVIGETVQHVEAGRFRVITTEGKKKLEVIFIAAENTIYFIDHKKKQIRVMDEEVFERMREMVKEAMMALESLPSEMREMMAANMGGPIEIVAGATGQTVGPYTCRIYRISQGTTPLAETCNAVLGRVTLQKAELRTLRELSALFEPLLMGSGGDPSMITFAEEVEGYPVRTRFLDKDGNATREHLVTSAVREGFGDDVFALPAKYKRKKMESRPRGGRRQK